jgi:hypothetical protein
MVSYLKAEGTVLPMHAANPGLKQTVTIEWQKNEQNQRQSTLNIKGIDAFGIWFFNMDQADWEPGRFRKDAEGKSYPKWFAVKNGSTVLADLPYPTKKSGADGLRGASCGILISETQYAVVENCISRERPACRDCEYTMYTPEQFDAKYNPKQSTAAGQ